MFETFTFSYLHFRRPPSSAPLPSLPNGITRHFVNTPSGKIEVLANSPSSPSPNATPIFFVHGGMGGAWVWLEYLGFLAGQQIPAYAVSMRGHGNSWHPSYLRMVFFTTKHMLATDAVAAANWVSSRHGNKPVVYVGHSSGGGLGQYILSSQMLKVKGLVLAAAVPGFGSLPVYINWWRLDPWFNIRMIFHGYHPNSPLSHPALTRRIFFSDAYPEGDLLRFQSRTNRYESFLWPFGMMTSFVKPANLLSQITPSSSSSGPSSSSSPSKILVLAGGIDAIMTPKVMKELASMYRIAFAGLVKQKKMDRDEGDDEVRTIKGEGGEDTEGQGVRLCFVPGAGHHLQNDVTWEIGAKKLVEFYRQL